VRSGASKLVTCAFSAYVIVSVITVTFVSRHRVAQNRLSRGLCGDRHVKGTQPTLAVRLRQSARCGLMCLTGSGVRRTFTRIEQPTSWFPKQCSASMWPPRSRLRTRVDAGLTCSRTCAHVYRSSRVLRSKTGLGRCSWICTGGWNPCTTGGWKSTALRGPVASEHCHSRRTVKLLDPSAQHRIGIVRR
jgi:hypothetical protein